MITWHEELTFDFSDPVSNEVFTENCIFFDIETTGFSPARTDLYLIANDCILNEKGITVYLANPFSLRAYIDNLSCKQLIFLKIHISSFFPVDSILSHILRSSSAIVTIHC